MRSIYWFKDISISDVLKVGGKNASLGEMYVALTPKGVRVPNGFAISAAAYQLFLRENKLDARIEAILSDLDTRSLKNLRARGRAVRAAILKASIPTALREEVVAAYRELSREYGTTNVDVAVRSSATAEDLPGASFAGQQETYLNVVGREALLVAVRECFASLFTDRAISYRVDKGFAHADVSLSIGVQKMVRSDRASSGILFTLDTETGFRGVSVVHSTWGLGELIVQGQVVPDEFQVFKATLAEGYPAIISRSLGSKALTMVYGGRGAATKTLRTPRDRQSAYSLSDREVLALARWGGLIEEHYGRPMDIEWAKDGETGELFIVQARPETIHATTTQGERRSVEDYVMRRPGQLVAHGAAVGSKIAEGRVRTVLDTTGIARFKKGEVLVTRMTDPDWEPIMKIASAIVTDEGGRTSHAAIVSRELGIPCVVGTGNGTKAARRGERVTVDCSTGSDGYIWRGPTEWEVRRYEVTDLPRPRTKVFVNIGSPSEAYEMSFLPQDGVGLAREEFIIASQVKVHPLALIHFSSVRGASVRREIERLTVGYTDKQQYYVDRLAEGVARIAAAFHPHPVIVRFSDFKTNEYASLLGGAQFEPREENPMIGWRGASRYSDSRFEEAFGLECRALRTVRDSWGLTNVVAMVPFCRTPEEGEKVLATMAKYGFPKGGNGLKVYVMAEVPSNVLQAGEFLDLFDGMSIGSNDLTQLTLGLDRDNRALAQIADERSPSVRALIKGVIRAAKERGKYIGICGQAPSDYPEFVQFLVEEGIDSISLNPDTVIKTTRAILEAEARRSAP